MMERGGAIVGTPDDAIAAIEHLLEVTEGFGGFLALAHEWASPEQTRRSFEMWAHYVMPHFQGQLEPIRSSNEWVSSHRDGIFGPQGPAIRKAYDDAGIASICPASAVVLLSILLISNFRISTCVTCCMLMSPPHYGVRVLAALIESLREPRLSLATSWVS